MTLSSILIYTKKQGQKALLFYIDKRIDDNVIHSFLILFQKYPIEQ